MLFKILSTMLRDFIAGLVMAVGCCCMMVAQALLKLLFASPGLRARSMG